MVGVVWAALLLGFAPARAWPYVLDKSVDGADVVPAAPTVYALRDKGMYPKFAALKTGKDRAKLSAFEELQYLQFKSKICHSGAHPIGRRIYGEVAEDGAAAASSSLARLDAALRVCEYRCTGGCLHGAVAAYALARGGQLAVAALCKRDAMRAIMGFGECSHAAGHALAQAEAGRWDNALQACEAQSETPSVAHYCAGGVIMEEGSKLFRAADRGVARLCERLPASARASCFYYGLRHAAVRSRNLTAVLDANCPDPPATDRGRGVFRACLYGAASGLVKDGMSAQNGQGGARACEALPDPRDRPHCVDGLMFRTAKYGTPAMVAATCAAFKDADLRALCADVADAGMYTLRKDALMRDYQEPAPRPRPPPDYGAEYRAPRRRR